MSDNQPTEAGNFRKKPVVIQAMRIVSKSFDHLQEVVHWIGVKGYHDGEFVYIYTLEGKMQADVGDWIIRGVKGEHYPCKPDIFALTYEPVTQPAEPNGRPALYAPWIVDAAGDVIGGVLRAGVDPTSCTVMHEMPQPRTKEGQQGMQEADVVVGREYIWMRDTPHSVRLRVEEIVKFPHDEPRVYTTTLQGDRTGVRTWNDMSRFLEACTPLNDREKL